MNDPGRLGYWGAVALGVGGMVGGGIFAVLGLAVQLADTATPVAFAIGGVVALITAYSYARLSVVRPSEGGTVTFLDWAFGSGPVTGSLNILLWLSYIVMASLYAYAFGSYGAAFLPVTLQPIWKHILASAVVVAVTGLNVLGATAVARAEKWIVAAKVGILLLFIAFGLQGLRLTDLTPSLQGSPLHLLVGGMMIFLAYEGFELIANVAGDVKNPRVVLPRAFFSAVAFVIVMYVLVAAVAVGNLSVDAIVAAKDYALAEAARPFLGSVGFSLIALAALFSTISAINATLYGSARLSYAVAKDGELPSQIAHRVWNQPLEGLLATSVLTLLVANLFDLSSISITGSAGFLLVFAAINLANFVLYKETESWRWISVLGAAACLAALATLVWYTAYHSPAQLLILGLMLILAVSSELAYRFWARREIRVGDIAPPYKSH